MNTTCYHSNTAFAQFFPYCHGNYCCKFASKHCNLDRILTGGWEFQTVLDGKFKSLSTTAFYIIFASLYVTFSLSLTYLLFHNSCFCSQSPSSLPKTSPFQFSTYYTAVPLLHLQFQTTATILCKTAYIEVHAKQPSVDNILTCVKTSTVTFADWHSEWTARNGPFTKCHTPQNTRSLTRNTSQ